MDDTLQVPRLDLSSPRRRRVTTQFAPERPAARWPWLIALAVLALAVLRPIDPTHEAERSTRAHELLRELSGQ